MSIKRPHLTTFSFQGADTSYYLRAMIVAFCWWEKPEYRDNITDLPHVTENLNHIVLYRVHLTWPGFEFTTLVVIGTGYMGSCKSIYHLITTTIALSTTYTRDIIYVQWCIAPPILWSATCIIHVRKKCTSTFELGDYDDCIERATIIARK
jgi:hypothetical protein